MYDKRNDLVDLSLLKKAIDVIVKSGVCTNVVADFEFFTIRKKSRNLFRIWTAINYRVF